MRQCTPLLHDIDMRYVVDFVEKTCNCNEPLVVLINSWLMDNGSKLFGGWDGFICHCDMRNWVRCAKSYRFLDIEVAEWQERNKLQGMNRKLIGKLFYTFTRKGLFKKIEKTFSVGKFMLYIKFL